jgi:hypothetical protein
MICNKTFLTSVSMETANRARTTVRAVLTIPGTPKLKLPKMPRPAGAAGAAYETAGVAYEAAGTAYEAEKLTKTVINNLNDK